MYLPKPSIDLQGSKSHNDSTTAYIMKIIHEKCQEVHLEFKEMKLQRTNLAGVPNESPHKSSLY